MQFINQSTHPDAGLTRGRGENAGKNDRKKERKKKTGNWAGNSTFFQWSDDIESPVCLFVCLFHNPSLSRACLWLSTFCPTPALGLALPTNSCPHLDSPTGGNTHRLPLRVFGQCRRERLKVIQCSSDISDQGWETTPWASSSKSSIHVDTSEESTHFFFKTGNPPDRLPSPLWSHLLAYYWLKVKVPPFDRARTHTHRLQCKQKSDDD